MIANLVSQVLGRDFPAQHLGRSHAHFAASLSEQGRFVGLLTWEALNGILDTHRLEAPRLRLAQNSDTIRPQLYSAARSFRRMPTWQQPLPHLVSGHPKDGATLVLDAVDELHPPVGALALALERLLRTAVQINVYASWTSTEGFGTHWDDHGVLVFQVAGAKRWRIYGPTRPNPMYRDIEFADTPPETPIAEMTLRAGDVLYVPRGWWHAAAASAGKPSLHLSCGLAPHTGVDLLTWVVDELRGDATVRGDVPQFGDAGERVSWVAELAKLVAERLADGDVISRYLDSRDATAPASGGFSLPVAVSGTLADPGVRVRLTVSRPVVTHTDSTVVLAAGGQRWTLAASAAPLVDLLAAGGVVTVGALAEASGQPLGDVAGLLAMLLDAGVLAAGHGPL
jgi:Cupin superfamily protein